MKTDRLIAGLLKKKKVDLTGIPEETIHGITVYLPKCMYMGTFRIYIPAVFPSTLLTLSTSAYSNASSLTSKQ